MPRLCAVVLVLLTIALTASPAGAAALTFHTTDRLDQNAPPVTAYPTGTSSVVVAASYQDVGKGVTLDFALLDAAGNRVASYQEPIWEGGSGALLARLGPGSPIPPGTYRIRVATGGTLLSESTITVGAVAPATATGTPAPPGGGPEQPAPAATPPVATPSSGPSDAPVQLAPSAQVAPGRIAIDLGNRAVSSTDPRQSAPDRRFGLANIHPDGAGIAGAATSERIAWMSRAVEAGAGFNRWEIRWDAIEPSPGTYVWADLDAVVAANQRAGLPLLAILIGTPRWAGAEAAAPPRGLAEPPILPDGSIGPQNPWGRFVHTVASRYRGGIAAYEIWNEPNRQDFWRGTPDDYYRLLSVAMASIRHADPSARVVFGGLDGYRDLTFLDRVLDAAAADAAPPGRPGAFDAMAWHAYHRPVDIYTGTQRIRERLRARNLAQPIWITETNVAAWDDPAVRGADAQPYRWSATGAEQSAFVVESFAYAIAADVERIFLYRASDTGEREAWGLLQSNGQPRLAERSFAFVTAALAGATGARRVTEPGLERIVIERPGERITVAWATGPADVALVIDALASRPATLRDKIGGAGAVEPIGGRYILSLPGASANQGADASDFLIGGDPYLLIERVP